MTDQPSAATLDTLQLKVIELAHRRATLRESGQAYCKLDGEPWPCNVQRLIASVRAARHAQQQAADLMAAAQHLCDLREANLLVSTEGHPYWRWSFWRWTHEGEGAWAQVIAALAAAEWDASSAGESAT